MFGKYWDPGHVKTRLAATIGDQAAAGIYREFLGHLSRVFAGVADRRVLSFSPSSARSAFEKLAGDAWELRPQSTGNLGQRLRHHFQRAQATGVTRCLVIGSDSPNLPPAYVERAWQLLDSSPVVLGPADDGGYYLIGFAHCLPDVFTNIDWGSNQVWQQTTRQLELQDLRFATLPTWYDVDDEDSLERLLAQLAESSKPAEQRLGATIRQILDTRLGA